MELFTYYAFHSVKNQLRKLFKTWVFVFLAICVVMGFLIGIGAAMIEDIGASRMEEYLPDDSDAWEYYDDEYADGWDDYDDEYYDAYDDEWDDYDDEYYDAYDDGWDDYDREYETELFDAAETVISIVTLAFFLFTAFSADRNGSKIFLPADVNLLFPSPITPQSALMFRLMTQIGSILIASVYLLFRLPNMMIRLGMSVWAAAAIMLAWALSILIAKLIQVLLYTVTAGETGRKTCLRRGIYVFLAALTGGFILFYRMGSAYDIPEAASLFFNNRYARWIPFWGWLKGFCRCAMESDTWGTAGFLTLSVAGSVLLACAIWRVKADFYEDAMAQSEQTAELLEQARDKQSGGIVFLRRKKDRSEKIRRDTMRHGTGANVYFFKTLYNRFRFAHLGVFTKTSEIYLAAALVCTLFLRFVLESDGLSPVLTVLGVMVFFRSLGNPLEEDTRLGSFVLIPESLWAKLFWSLLGGTVNVLLDLLPAVMVSLVILRGSILTALFGLAVILSVDFYATCVGTFIHASVPVSAGRIVKQLVQILFLYFGLLPDIALLMIGAVLDWGIWGYLGAIGCNLGIGALFFALTAQFLDPAATVTTPSEPWTVPSAPWAVPSAPSEPWTVPSDPMPVSPSPMENVPIGSTAATNGTSGAVGDNRDTDTDNPSTNFPYLQAVIRMETLSRTVDPGPRDHGTIGPHRADQYTGTDDRYTGTDDRYTGTLGKWNLGVARRCFSRLGLGACVILGVTALAQIILTFLLLRFWPDWSEDIPWLIWLVTFGPMYAFGVPAGLRVMRTVPAARPMERRFGTGNFLTAAAICVFMMYVGSIFGTAVTAALETLFHISADNPIEPFAEDASIILKMLFLVCMGPMVEEWIFRRYLLDRMRIYGEKTAVITSALMFGLFHGNLSQMFYASTLGLVFGFVYLRTGRLRYTLALHMGINFMGGIVGPGLLEYSDELTVWASQMRGGLSGGAIALMIYMVVMIGLFLLGGILLLIRGRDIRFTPREWDLPMGTRLWTVCINAGMLGLFALCMGEVVLTFLTTRPA